MNEYKLICGICKKTFFIKSSLKGRLKYCFYCKPMILENLKDERNFKYTWFDENYKELKIICKIKPKKVFYT